jgi:phosphoribosylanthranilate isomerase
MGLKTTVKVGRITNLSDARYCAGMGVDLLGFNAVENRPDYISPIQFEELRGWFVGPKVVIEIYGIDKVQAYEALLNNYQPDMIELSCHELLKLRPRDLPLILSILPDQYHDQAAVLRDFKSSIQFLQLPANTDKKLLQEIVKNYQVLLSLAGDAEPDINFLKKNPGLGLALSGTTEEKAGYKSYDQLATVLEQLEED